MITRTLLGVETGLLGFGGMRFPVGPDGKIQQDLALAMLDKAYENGVTYYDTAYPYHNQESEAVMGKWQETKPRETIQLATKLPVWTLKSRENGGEIFRQQLERMRTNYFDFYLLHALSAGRWKKVQELGLLSMLDRLKEQGLVKQAGFSFHDRYPVFEEILKAYPWDFCQIQLNYADKEQQAGLRGYHLAEELGIPVIVMEPVKGGRLAKVPPFSQELFNSLHPEWTPSSWALRWAANLSNVAVVLSGMSTMEQVEDNLRTFENPQLTEADQDAIQKAVNDIASLQKVACTGCRYCMPCPEGVLIPDIFQLYNEASMFGVREESVDRYSKYGADQKASACVQCGKCASLCPQLLKVPALLEEANSYLT